jgi:hypothetical protein
VLGAVVLLAPTVWAKDGDIRLSTALSGSAIGGVVPSGHADYRARGSERRFSVEVEDVKLSQGTVLSILVQGVEVGTVALDGLGFADLNLDSRIDTVPVVAAGSVIVVTVKTSGQAILSGVI